MVRKSFFTFITIAMISVPAQADEVGYVFPATIQDVAQIVMFALATTITAYLAFLTFNLPPVSLADEPMLPRYMTQKRLYYSGVVAYIIICAAAYSVFEIFFNQLLPFANYFVPPTISEFINKLTKQGPLTYPATIVLATALFAILLRTNVDWNPLFLLRRLVWSWVSIPQLANTIMLMTRDELLVPLKVRMTVANNPDFPHVDSGDFDKGRHSLDRRWAELCYIRDWLNRNRAQGAHYTFFNEPSLSWDKLETEYQVARKSIAPLKRALSGDEPLDLSEVAEKINTLRKQYCRLAACFIVFKNETKKKIASDARSFGIPMGESISRANPMRYLLMFLVAIIVAIYAGVFASAMSWDLFHPTAAGAMNQEPDVFVKWTCYGLANYGMPVLAALALCYLGWAVNHEQPSSYPASYARIFLIALCVSAVSLTCAVIIGGAATAAKPVGLLLIHEVNWSLSPALVAVYVVHHVDRQIDPSLPDILPYGSYRHLVQRLIKCGLFGLLTTSLSLQSALSMEAPPGYAWPTDKLRVVVIGTIFAIGFTVGLVGEFLIVKPRSPATPSELNDGVAIPG